MNKILIPEIWISICSGGRFYGGRTVYSVGVEFPMLKTWWTDNLTRNGYDKVRSLLDENKYSKRNLEMKGGRRGSTIKGGYKEIFCFDETHSDIVLAKMFGYNTMQAYWRRVAKTKMWAKHRHRSGNWLLSENILHMNQIPRTSYWKHSSTYSKIPKEYLWAFKDMIEKYDLWRNNWENNEKFVLDYSDYDIGEDRKPPVWECNLCGHYDIKENWRWSRPPGFASHDYITHCPKCNAKGTDTFTKMFDFNDEYSEEKKFMPFMRMQDDFLFTL